MANMNITSPTAAKIYSSWLKLGRSERPRTYLGASIIGHECDRYLWLYFRGCVNDNFDGRMYRLFDRGKREEAVFCADLRRIGCEVKEFDESGSQIGVSAFGNHFGGHLDGVVRGIPEAPKQWHVVEFKTHSSDSFKKLCKEGVEKAKPMHYAQMTVYMGLTGLKSALYMAVNKDNDDLWCERIKLDDVHYDIMINRAKYIICSSEPSRCANRRDDFRCKACPCASLCWHDAKEFIDPALPLTCRTCCHSTADIEHEGANWVCSRGHACSTEQGACEDYLPLPIFVKGVLTEGDANGMLYSVDLKNNTDGLMVGKTGFSAKELQKFGPEELRSIKAVRASAPSAKVVGTNTLEMKYSDRSKYSVYFSGTMEEFSKWIEENPIADFTKPGATEKFGNAEYYEYPPSTLVKIADGKAVVICENPPF